ncbi:MAG: hypothetical protein DRR42_24210 [Gammaproteobacteria bacterium]|nr:MAG: hypothetical protein DRR42_24210 [Gammaproteobacteria bacterium]
MNTKKILYSASLITLLYVVPFTSTETVARSNATSADICDIKNLSGKKKNSIREQNGEIVNISNDTKIPISCPISRDFLALEYNVIIKAWNYASSQRTFKCTFQELDNQSFVIRTWNRSVQVQPSTSGALSIVGKQLINPINRFHANCTLPPGGAFGAIFVDNIN